MVNQVFRYYMGAMATATVNSLGPREKRVGGIMDPGATLEDSCSSV